MRGLPAGWYLDPARGPIEYAAIIAPAWHLACHVADLPAPGTAARLDCAGRSAFVLRARDGSLRAWRNACPHRGARLIDGDLRTGFAFCVDARVRCPYHGWTYDDHGQLESVPAGQRFEPIELENVALEALPVVQWRGLVWVSLDASAPPFDAQCGFAGEAWPDATPMRRLAEPRIWPVLGDWKLACEYLLDSAHASVARARPAPSAFEPPRFRPGDLDDPWLRAASAPAFDGRRAWPARVYHSLFARTSPSPRVEWLFAWPNLLLQATHDTLYALQVLPVRAGACTLRLLRFGLPDTSREAKVSRHLQARIFRREIEEAVALIERTHAGLANLAPEAAAAIDGGQVALQWFATRYRVACVDAGPLPASRRRPRSRSKPNP